MRDWTGYVVNDIADPTLRDKLARITYYLADLSRGMGRIQQGLVPDGSGDPISSISDDGLYLKLLGRPGNQDAHGGTGPGGTLTLSSTTATTKGLIYLGDALGSAYDEVNNRLGIGTVAPAARLQLEHTTGGSTTQAVVPTSLYWSNPSGGWSGVGGTDLSTLCQTNDGATTYIKGDATTGGYDVTMGMNKPTNPSVFTGWSLNLWARKQANDAGDHPVIGLDVIINAATGYSTPGVGNGTFGGITQLAAKYLGDPAVVSGSVSVPILGPLTTSFALYSYALTTAQASAIVAVASASYLVLDVNTRTNVGEAGTANNFPEITHSYIEAPGLLDTTPLQRWKNTATQNDLNYVADSTNTTTLQFSGTPKLRITSGLELAIGSPTVSAVWTASDTDGTGAWAASGGSIYLDHGSSIYWRNLANTAYLRMLNSDSGDNFWVGREANDSVFIYASGAQQMRIRSNGVTIGSGSVPRGRLDVVGGSITIDNGQTVQMRNFANTAFINTFKTDTSDNLYFGGDTDMGDLFLSDNVGLEALRVNAAYVRIYNNLRTYGGITQFGTATGALTLQAPATITTHTLTLPSAQGGASTVLTNDGAGALSWSSSASGLATKIQHRFVANGPYRIDGDVDGAMIAQRAMTLTKFNLYRRLGGTSGSTAVDLRNNGATVLSTVPGIAFNAGASATASGIIGTAAVAAGDRITVSASAVDGGRPYDWVALVEGY